MVLRRDFLNGFALGTVGALAPRAESEVRAPSLTDAEIDAALDAILGSPP